MNAVVRIIRPALLLMVVVAGGLMPLPATHAHDEHNNLPSTGVAVEGHELRISREAEKSLGIATTVVHLQDLEHDVMANAAIEVPWRKHAFATSLVAGRISRVHVQPGDRVEKGQVLAQVESQEIEDLQSALLKAASEFDLANRLLEATGQPRLERQHVRAPPAGIRDDPQRIGRRAGHPVLKLLSLGLTATMVDDVLTTRQAGPHGSDYQSASAASCRSPTYTPDKSFRPGSRSTRLSIYRRCGYTARCSRPTARPWPKGSRSTFASMPAPTKYSRARSIMSA